MARQIGLFGGTFDPIHNGHLLIAEMARELATLDEVVFIPSARPPHKTNQTILDFEHRLAMTSLAIAGDPSFVVSDVEQRFADLSYTIKTLEWMKEHHPDDSFSLIIGSDSLLALDTWKDPDRIVELADIIVYKRLDFNPEKAEDRFRKHARIIDRPIIDVSSTWIRERIATGESIRYLLPPDVEQYITDNNLYQNHE